MAGALARTGVASINDLTQRQGVRDVLQWLTREKQWINEQHLALCRIAAPTFLERARAEWMGEQMQGLGWTSQIDRAGNVVARFSPWSAGDGLCVAATAHLDTVLAPRTRDDVTVGPDGRFRGPGVSDNGAGLAALLALAKALKSCPPLVEPPVPLLLIANVGEEGEGNLSGMRYLCRQSPLAAEIGAFLVLDGPATDHITAEALASQRFEITFSGQGGHSWSDFGIGNPVHALSRAIAFFTEQKIALRNGVGPRCSYNFGLIEGGASVNSIPNSARAKLDIRSEDEEKVAELAAMLTVAVDRALEVENERASGGRLTARIRDIGARPGGKLAEDAPLLSYLRAVDQYLGIRSHVDCSSTDANIPLSLGIPAVSIGTGGQGGGAHTSSEWYSPEGRDLGLKRIVLVLALLLRDLQSGAGRLAGE